MKYYTETIPVTLAEKLKKKGMPIESEGNNVWCPPYAEVFDWLMERGIFIDAYPLYNTSDKMYSDTWCFSLMSNKLGPNVGCDELQEDWHEAANAAIEKALTLI